MVNLPGGPEIVVIMLVALIVLGPQQLPKAMRTMGSVMSEIRKISSGFQNEMRNAMDSITDDSQPSEASPAAVTSSSTAASMEEADVTEVVARNTGSDDPDPGPADEPAPARPAIDPVDRAAG